VSRMEDRLRDAYLDEAGTVTPDSIRRLGEAIAARSQWPIRSRLRSRLRSGRPGRARGWGGWGRWLAPVAAAAAVAVIVIVAAVAVPRDAGQSQPKATGATTASTPKFLIADVTGVSPLQVRNATTGALVAQVTVPKGYPGPGRRTYITSVATSNGRDYLVAEYANPCRSWIYQFRLDSAGQPSVLTPFAALPTVPSELYNLTVSGNGQMVGFTTTACMGAKAQPNYVGVTNVRTGHTTRWTVPARNSVDDVSLTADGKQLCYSLQLSPSVVRVIPTSAAPGSASAIGRTVAQAPSGQWISFSAISADGSKVYFTTYTSPPIAGQVRVVDLTTGRSRFVYAPAGSAGLITSDPGVRYLLLQIQEKGPSTRLARLDLADGKVTYLPSGWLGMGAVLCW
jgi:hypothetical protein